MYETNKFFNLLFRATIIPGVIIVPWLTGLISIVTVQLCLVSFFIIFVVFPLIFRYSYTLQRGILFLTFITYPKNLDLKDPNSVNLCATRNFYLNVKDPDVDKEDGVRIGVWHVLPIQLVKRFARELNLNEKSLEEIQNTTDIDDPHLNKMESIYKAEFPAINEQNEQSFYEQMLKHPGTIVLYLHGNTASRGSGHRIDMYKVFRKLGYHVLTLDYRGYGDSDKIAPTEEGVVRDAMTVYNYIANRTNNPVIIWGHSLGTGVGTHLMAQLSNMNVPGPRALILESPFTNIKDEIRKHPFARPFKDLPWFDMTIANPMYYNSLRFESDQHISEFRQPVLILHAEDDYVVPFQLGYKLYRTALDTRGKSWGPVEFHRFDASLHYGHKFLCTAPNLPEIVKKFVDTYKNEIF
ncbi:lysophosphatidylserine lipase ABHD12 isoform X1 [Eupeodes corollae]|uniref:lysophosphatidylserine lipase ABHD12 isoform X1 n=1 Tax=Eupeodes corollae TaxID=290404 RepID=UPI002490F04D|nr:lysophosphatidylserine lipase ABHD12 isoform X1 [Eupeodes corollae]